MFRPVYHKLSSRKGTLFFYEYSCGHMKHTHQERPPERQLGRPIARSSTHNVSFIRVAYTLNFMFPPTSSPLFPLIHFPLQTVLKASSPPLQLLPLLSPSIPPNPVLHSLYPPPPFSVPFPLILLSSSTPLPLLSNQFPLLSHPPPSHQTLPSLSCTPSPVCNNVWYAHIAKNSQYYLPPSSSPLPLSLLHLLLTPSPLTLYSYPPQSLPLTIPHNLHPSSPSLSFSIYLPSSLPLYPSPFSLLFTLFVTLPVLLSPSTLILSSLLLSSFSSPS